MYGRDYDGETLNFEASGGLTNASLVMQDKQTDTYWSLMKGMALAGKMKGQTLKELPIGEKTTWKEWRTKHPTTKVLSVDSREDDRNLYHQYFRNGDGFQGLRAKDNRLKTKSPIFAFRLNDKSFAVPYSEFESGTILKLPDGKQVFLYRNRKDNIFQSTSAFVSSAGFVKQEERWTEKQTGTPFDDSSREFGGKVERLSGFDTFWYNWSLNNPETELLTSQSNGSIGSGTRQGSSSKKIPDNIP